MSHSKGPRWPQGEDNSGESSIQANPNKTKQNCLDFLGFIRLNWDLSVGYAKKTKKSAPVFIRGMGCAQRSRSPRPIDPTRSRSRGLQTYIESFAAGADFRWDCIVWLRSEGWRRFCRVVGWLSYLGTAEGFEPRPPKSRASARAPGSGRGPCRT